MAASRRRTAGRTRKYQPAARRATGKRRREATRTEPAVIPMISYEDGIAALEWLRKAFGFRETARMTTPDGRLSHGEMEAGAGLIMLASPSRDYQGPKRHREICEQARKWSTVPWIIDGVLVEVDHLVRHLRRSRTAGATILSELE